MNKSLKYNHLKDEKSTYLTQHIKSPIHWHPYEKKALLKAQDEEKPIFLSIGYSSSHLCRVMSEESFSDSLIADFLNSHFISIKVDKEELPDIDQYYQLACQMLHGQNGWPLNVFLTSRMEPFLVHTYLPKQSTANETGFFEVLQHIQKDYKQNFQRIQLDAQKIVTALQRPIEVEHKIQFEGHFPGAASIINALKDYQDNDFGGYGSDIKFAQYSFVEWGVEHILEGMVPEELGIHMIKSLENSLMGGLYDHVKGGVHRYATERTWTVPHFEKMLYDQAGLLKLLSKASLIYPSPLIFDGMIQTLDYLRNEMLSEQGYFFSAQGADSEGIEGLYYTFSKDEFVDACIQYDESLSDQMDQILGWFSITEQGNFAGQLNVIRLAMDKKEDLFSPEGWVIVRKVKKALSEARKLRVPPQTDYKGIASWNFFLLTSLLDVIQYCKIEAVKSSAFNLLQKTYRSILATFIQTDADGQTRINVSTTRPSHLPLIEDYIFFAEFCFRFYELFGAPHFLENAHLSIQYIFKDFFKDDIFYTRSIKYMDSEEYKNIHTPIFDQPYRSALGVLLGLIRKWRHHFKEYEQYMQQITLPLENMTHLCLHNPLNFGEMLRALTYPDMAYKKIEIPLSWKKESLFNKLYLNFSFRFILIYHEKDQESWQICHHHKCEQQGRGLESFIKIFTSPPEETAI